MRVHNTHWNVSKGRLLRWDGTYRLLMLHRIAHGGSRKRQELGLSYLPAMTSVFLRSMKHLNRATQGAKLERRRVRTWQADVASQDNGRR